MDPHELRPADERILEYLESHPPEYIPLIANRLGMPLGYAQRRCEHLVERELMKPVTNEAIYRLTDQGARVLAGEAGTVRATDDA